MTSSSDTFIEISCVYSPTGADVLGIAFVLFCLSSKAGDSAPCVIGCACLTYSKTFYYSISQSGAGLFAFVALLLLTLPVVLTFHALFAVPRLADRRRTDWYSLHPRCKPLYALRLQAGNIFIVPSPNEVPQSDGLFYPVSRSLEAQVKQRLCGFYEHCHSIALFGCTVL